MLFKQSQGDIQNFQIDELFKEKTISQGLITIERPTVLSMKPQDLYQQIKHLAKWRYDFDLPESQS